MTPRDPLPPAPRRARTVAFGLAVLAPFLGLACEQLRDRDGDGGQHPAGWLDEKSADFHGTYLEKARYPLADCRVCHGDQYQGDAVAGSCSTSSCHQEGVEACGTCHGEGIDPRPATGAHGAHLGSCAGCHPLPHSAREAQHPNGAVEIAFTGEALANGATPTWDPVTATCSEVYCHGGSTPRWETPSGGPSCDFCHGAPPVSHGRWSVAQSTSACVDCHPSPEGPYHANGNLDVNPLACDACHGSGPLGVPPNALDGSTEPTDRGVGAHRRHLDFTLEDRIGKVVPCEVCHAIPASLDAPGHLDLLSPVDVVLPGDGVFDPGSGRCVTGCHWDRSPGPQFQDASGAERACDACHGMPPLTTRKGVAHPQVEGSLATCLVCHAFDPAQHVDGKVDFAP